ncbi:MAG: SIS domain-containing protein [Kouleothrix sp.]|jgi:glucosamine--fructose-6-phosphate aminotransferase (isomerizing)|nr:SIS domain-containing protein [Kouleothrix sp.]
MPPFNDYTWHEIQSQPDAWAATLALLQARGDELRMFLRANPVSQVLYTGCGSTYYLALAAAAALRELAGLPAAGLPASEVWLNPAGSCPTSQPTMLVAISRSGATTETLRAIESFRAAGRGPILTLSCYPDQPMARLGDLNLVLVAGQEQSIAQTRAFSTLLLACLALASAWGERAALQAELERLPAAGRQLLGTYAALAHELGANTPADRYFFLGSGARYGLACELSLKMKEMSLSESEPFHFLEYRHGPQSMARPGTLIVGLHSDSIHTYEAAVLAEMRALGAQAVSIGTHDADVTLADIAEPVRGPLYLPFGQMLAYERAIRRGLTPDQPSQLTAVVRLDR